MDTKGAFKMYCQLASTIEQGLVASCHDMSDGGLAVAACESALGGMCGCDIDLSGIPGDAGLDDIRTLFAESPSRFVISVKKGNADKFEALMAGTPFKRVGQTNGSGTVAFGRNGKAILAVTCDEIVKAWKREI